MHKALALLSDTVNIRKRKERQIRLDRRLSS